MIKRLKLSYQVYNFFQRGKLKHNQAAFDKYGIRKKYFSSISSKDLPKDGPEDPALNEPAFNAYLREQEVFKTMDEKTRQNLMTWSNNGCLVLEKFFDETTVDRINQEMDDLVERKKAHFRYGGKVMFAIHESEYLNNIGEHKKLKDILKLLLQKEAVLFQSINFFKGSGQRTHSDSIHMSTYPVGNLIAVWVALEDIDESNGALHYYEGSHRLPYYMNQDFGNAGTKWMLGNKTYYDYEDFIDAKINEKCLQKKVFRAKKGDVFIWHANLLHGGEPHLDKARTRKSMVFHYFGEGVVCYHEVTQRPALRK